MEAEAGVDHTSERGGKKSSIEKQTKPELKCTHWSLCETRGAVCSFHTGSLYRAELATGNINTDKSHARRKKQNKTKTRKHRNQREFKMLH